MCDVCGAACWGGCCYFVLFWGAVLVGLAPPLLLMCPPLPAPPRPSPGQVWDTLMACFERSILNTHRSKFVQFLLFYVAYKGPETASRAFVDLLLDRMQVGGGVGVGV